MLHSAYHRTLFTPKEAEIVGNCNKIAKESTPPLIRIK